jgi:hypothetical protein
MPGLDRDLTAVVEKRGGNGQLLSKHLRRYDFATVTEFRCCIYRRLAGFTFVFKMLRNDKLGI